MYTIFISNSMSSLQTNEHQEAVMIQSFQKPFIAEMMNISKAHIHYST